MNATKRQPRLKYAEANDKASIADPLGLIVYFHQTLSGVQDLDRDSFHPNEFAFAQELIAKRNPSDAQSFVAWGIDHARQTKYPVRQLDGLRFLVNDWLKAKQATERVRAKQEQEHADRQKQAQLGAYENWTQQKVQETLRALPAEDRAALTERARVTVEAENPVHNLPPKLIQTIIEKRIGKHIKDGLALPTFEQWLAHSNR